MNKLLLLPFFLGAIFAAFTPDSLFGEPDEVDELGIPVYKNIQLCDFQRCDKIPDESHWHINGICQGREKERSKRIAGKAVNHG
jgi:hypothetical protein